MWAVFAILVCLVIMLLAYIAQSAMVHERKELERTRKEIEDVEAEIKKALDNEPENYALHTSLGNKLNRLRKYESDILR